MDNISTTTEAVEHATGEISKYSDLIQTYGASIVILAVFIVVLLAMFGYILKSNQKTNNQLIQQQQQLLDALVKKDDGDNNHIVQPEPSIHKEPNLIKMFLGINDRIKDILKDIGEEVDCARTAVYVFHNGSYSSHGLPFFKVSCVCETIKIGCGVVKNINNHTCLPLQMFDNSISYIYKNSKLYILDTYDIEDPLVKSTPMMIGMLKNNNIRSASAIAIYDNDSNIVGILLVEFTEVHDKEFMSSIEKSLVEKASLLSPILEYSGIYNKDTTN